MSFIAEIFLSEFTCPVCIELMSPPIKQCVIGHAICDACYLLLNKCPTCREPLSLFNSCAMETLYKKFNFPCKYRDDGCEFMGKGTQLTKHQSRCPFAVMTCPFVYTAYCWWTGNADEYFEHCEEQHLQFTRKGSEQTYTMKNMQEIKEESSIFNMIQAHGKTFQLAVHLFTEGYFRYRLILIAFNDEIVKYILKINFGNSFRTSIVKSFTDVPYENIFDCESYVTEAETIREVCQENNGDFIYKICIIEEFEEEL